MDQDRGRIAYLDALRAIACMCVVMIHCSTRYASDYAHTADFWAGNVLSSVSRAGVSLFLMISGALMLDEGYQLTKKKTVAHIVRMVPFFVFWSAVYCLVFQILGPRMNAEPISISAAAAAFVKGYSHLWYVYCVIGIYLIIPLLRLWVKKENQKYVRYFLLLAFVFGFVLPQITLVGGQYFSGLRHIDEILNDRLQLKYVSGLTAYVVLGWYLHTFEIRAYKALYIAGILCLIATIAGTFLLFETAGVTETLLYRRTSALQLVWSAAVFVFFKRFFRNRDAGRFLRLVSRLSLGVYAVHPMIIKLAWSVFEPALSQVPLIWIPLTYVPALCLSCGVSYILGLHKEFKYVV
ncbi:MAG: acyltransferase family protein [Clostridiales bacterium]|nr:acyltransferase family protein [Clostridiales bacterium]